MNQTAMLFCLYFPNTTSANKIVLLSLLLPLFFIIIIRSPPIRKTIKKRVNTTWKGLRIGVIQIKCA